MDDQPLPADLSPLNLKAWTFTALSLCGCSDMVAVLGGLRDFLGWHAADLANRPGYETLFGGNEAVFYVFAGILDRLDLSEHGSSVRGSWLTEDGKRLLLALRTTPLEEIDDAHGKAYDGCDYPDADGEFH